MPNEETMLASLENTGVDIMPAAVIPGDIPFSWKNHTSKLFQAAKPSYFPVEKGTAAGSKPGRKKFL